MSFDNDEGESAVFIRKEPCPDCGSRDNLARYSDGGAYCFGCGRHEHGDSTMDNSTAPVRVSGLVEDLSYQALTSRGITQETCEKFRYGVGRLDDQWVQVANYPPAEGHGTIAQHIRGAGKDFKWRGEAKAIEPLWGMHIWRDNGKKVVICEGEIDAMSVSQAQGNKWPVVSVPNGAQAAAKDVGKALGWLSKYEQVIFMFDADEPGQAAAKACAKLLPPGKAFIAVLPEGIKDPNEMLQAGRIKDIADVVWGAREFRPDGIVTLDDILDDIRKPVEVGVSWPWQTLTALTYGRRKGELYALGAGTGVGKTDVFSECIAHDVVQLGIPTAVFAFEAKPADTAKRVAGKVGNRSFHIPTEGEDVPAWTPEELEASIAKMQAGGNLHLYDSWGSCEWPAVESAIEYLHAAHDVQSFYVDHLTAFASSEPGNEKNIIEEVMSKMASLAQRLNIYLHFISHLNTPEGKPHEEGGRVTIRNFKGSRSIGFWSHYMIGLERDQQDEDPTRQRTTTVRVLKDRYTGKATGKTFELYFNDEGRLTESVPDIDHGFSDTTGGANSDF